MGLPCSLTHQSFEQQHRHSRKQRLSHEFKSCPDLSGVKIARSYPWQMAVFPDLNQTYVLDGYLMQKYVITILIFGYIRYLYEYRYRHKYMQVYVYIYIYMDIYGRSAKHGAEKNGQVPEHPAAQSATGRAEESSSPRPAMSKTSKGIPRFRL